ncbi:hypothetical protein ACIBQ5_37435, partial [Streptomyces massasporeus]|uniref:hypothetical protein n=1 Tax=Streptomyces massasporeus TaxID=67324 RepID=UPI0037929977
MRQAPSGPSVGLSGPVAAREGVEGPLPNSRPPAGPWRPRLGRLPLVLAPLPGSAGTSPSCRSGGFPEDRLVHGQ